MPKKISKPKRTYSSNYSKNWVRWVIIYLFIGGLIYLAIYAFFIQQGNSTYP